MTNPLTDPFAIKSSPVAPVVILPPAPAKSSTVPLPPLDEFAPDLPTPSLPAGLRALLIRDNGAGLLAAANTDSTSIPVANGKPVRIGNYEYTAEVTATEIRLYTKAPRVKLVWQGTLGGPAQVIAPIDMSQVHFSPPLSAGVNPGLRASGASDANSGSLILKNGVQ